MIEMRGLKKAFKAVTALDGVSMTARDGSVTGLIGPNGAGKTTAFRIVYGILSADDGAATIDGIDVAVARIAAQERLGVLPDVRGMYPRLTGREHIRYHGRLRGMDAPTLENRIDALVERLGMAEFVDRRAKGYSRGQELKVALARALVHEPKNLILDEPSNGLDVISGRAVRTLIKEMRDAGHCILVSSHIMSEVQDLCDHLVVIAHGRIIAEGSPDSLRAETGCDDLEDAFIDVIGHEPRPEGVA